MGRRDELIRLLADGQLHGGPALASELGCSRAAVWKMLQQFPGLGLQVISRQGGGYRLSGALDLLNARSIRASLSSAAATCLQALDVAMITESTSLALRASPAPAFGRAEALLAEFQTGGRGRRDRAWLSPLGSGLCLSLSWSFEHPPGGLAGLGLAVGVAVRDVLAGFAPDVRLKWPNDIVTPSGKLAGLLVDVEGETSGPLKAVVGVGVNVASVPALPVGDATTKQLLPTCLASEDGLPDRNQLAASLLDQLISTLVEFTAHGFAPFADRWRRWDAYSGQAVEIAVGARRRVGIARGITAEGALLLEVGGQLEQVYSGDVSLRPAA